MNKLILLLFLLSSSQLFSQFENYLRWEPSVLINFKNDTRWSYNLSIVNRDRFKTPLNSSEYEHHEMNLFASYIIDRKKIVTGGIRFRHLDPFDDEPGFENRISEQIAFINKVGSNRVVHRLRSEQRFKNNNFDITIRYRPSFDVPLNGTTIDPDEFYFLVYNEIIWQIDNDAPSEFENRITAGLGYYFSRTLKFQADIQYRISDIGLDKVTTGTFIFTKLYWTIRS